MKMTSVSRASGARRLPARVILVLVMAAPAVGLLPVGVAAANVRLAFPEETPGPPYYARISSDGAPQTEQWAAIVFYRDPGCVPSGFNLLQFFDIPRAFGCPLTVEGFEIWKNGPGQDPAPIQVKSRGLGAVPVWFVSPAELAAAMADGVLTIGELSALPSLQVGTADSFQEVLHPSEAAKHGKLTITASGTLSDGRAFQLQVSASRDRLNHVKISFALLHTTAPRRGANDSSRPQPQSRRRTS